MGFRCIVYDGKTKEGTNQVLGRISVQDRRTVEGADLMHDKKSMGILSMKGAKGHVNYYPTNKLMPKQICIKEHRCL